MTVKLLDHMGNDLTVVNSARVSFHKESKQFTDNDAGLIRYLAKHNHWTPFAHPQIQFRIAMPFALARQWFKHQIGFVRSEVSRRYVDDAAMFYLPEEWRERPEKSVKQGSGASLSQDMQDQLDDLALMAYSFSQTCYDRFIELNVAPEQARFVLPLGAMTEFIETGSLAAYARLYNLRTEKGAQKDVKVYAEKVGDQIAELFPCSWAALIEGKK